MNKDDVHLSFLPLAHSMERTIQVGVGGVAVWPCWLWCCLCLAAGAEGVRCMLSMCSPGLCVPQWQQDWLLQGRHQAAVG